MGSITRHRAAVKTNSKRTVSAYLQIVINDVPYKVQGISPGEDGTVAFRLEKQGGKAEVYDLIRDHHGLIRCDCPSYESTYAGTTSTCKHGQALVIVGLMDAPRFIPATNGPIYPPSPDELTEAPAPVPVDPAALIYGARVRHQVADGTWKIVASVATSPTIRVRQLAENGSMVGPVQTWDRSVVGAIVADEPAPVEATCCPEAEPQPCATCVEAPPADEPIKAIPRDPDALPGHDDEHLSNALPDDVAEVPAWPFADWISFEARRYAGIDDDRCRWMARQIERLARQARFIDAKDPADYDDRSDIFGFLDGMHDDDQVEAEDLDDAWRDSPEYAW